jgi:zinc transporter ZupT
MALSPVAGGDLLEPTVTTSLSSMRRARTRALPNSMMIAAAIGLHNFAEGSL